MKLEQGELNLIRIEDHLVPLSRITHIKTQVVHLETKVYCEVSSGIEIRKGFIPIPEIVIKIHTDYGKDYSIYLKPYVHEHIKFPKQQSFWWFPDIVGDKLEITTYQSLAFIPGDLKEQVEKQKHAFTYRYIKSLIQHQEKYFQD